MAHTKSKHDQPEQTPHHKSGFGSFFLTLADTKGSSPWLVGMRECPLVHQIRPIDTALEQRVQRNRSVLESAKCICIFVQVAWTVGDARENMKSSHEHNVLCQDLCHANCHGDFFCRCGISSAIVSALMTCDRATCVRQSPVNAICQCKLGQEFPNSNVFLHIRSCPIPVFTGFSQ